MITDVTIAISFSSRIYFPFALHARYTMSFPPPEYRWTTANQRSSSTNQTQPHMKHKTTLYIHTKYRINIIYLL